MRSSLKHCFLSVLLVCVSLTAQAQKKYDIRLNYPTGAKYSYDMTTKSDQRINEQNMSTEMTIGCGMNVTDVTDGVRSISSTIDRFKMDINMGEVHIAADTRDAEPTIDDVKSNPLLIMQKLFKNFTGQPYTMKINTTGEVLEVDGYEQMMRSAIQKIAWTDEVRASLEEKMMKSFSNESMRKMMEQSFRMYPAQPVAIGESWTNTLSMEMFGDMGISTTYTLRSVKKGKAMVDMTSEFDMNGSTMKMKGTQKGNMTIAIESGLIELMDMTMLATTETNGTPIDMTTHLVFKGKEVKK